MPRLSASTLFRAFKCEASAILPRVDFSSPYAERGRAIHAFLKRVNDVGREKALKEVGAAHRADCAALDVKSLPLDGKSVASEVSFLYDVTTDTAREVGRDIDRAYGDRKPTEIPGTADIVGVSMDAVHVSDFKSGRGYDLTAPPVGENPQLLFYALAAARAYGKSSATVEIIRLGADGETFSDIAEVDAFALDFFAGKLKETWEKLAKAEQLVTLGVKPKASAGEHCRYCPSIPFCEAQMSLVRAVTQDPAEFEHEVVALTPVDAATAYRKLKLAEAVLAQVRASIELYAEAAPIDLGNGVTLGPVDTERESVDGSVAHGVLTNLHGDDIAAKAVTLDSSKAAIVRALRPVAEAKNVPLAQLEREALAEIRRLNGIQVKTFHSVKETKAKGQRLPPNVVRLPGLPAPQRQVRSDVRASGPGRPAFPADFDSPTGLPKTLEDETRNNGKGHDPF